MEYAPRRGRGRTSGIVVVLPAAASTRFAASASVSIGSSFGLMTGGRLDPPVRPVAGDLSGRLGRTGRTANIRPLRVADDGAAVMGPAVSVVVCTSGRPA